MTSLQELKTELKELEKEQAEIKYQIYRLGDAPSPNNPMTPEDRAHKAEMLTLMEKRWLLFENKIESKKLEIGKYHHENNAKLIKSQMESK